MVEESSESDEALNSEDSEVEAKSPSKKDMPLTPAREDNVLEESEESKKQSLKPKKTPKGTEGSGCDNCGDCHYCNPSEEALEDTPDEDIPEEKLDESPEDDIVSSEEDKLDESPIEGSDSEDKTKGADEETILLGNINKAVSKVQDILDN